MELQLQDMRSVLTVSKTVFGYDFNKALVYQIITAYAAAARCGTRAQKSRAEVSGSGRKPWRQKGTGRARSGSIRSPIWRSGGVTFAARPRDYTQKVNKKMYRNAMKSILSELVRQSRLIVVENFSIEAPKTKLLVQKMKGMALKNVLIVTRELEENLFLAARNIHGIRACNAISIDPVSLISFDKVVMTIDAVKQVEDMLT